MTKTFNLKLIVAVMIGVIVAISVSVFAATREVTYVANSSTLNYGHFVALNATTSQATSTAIDVRRAKSAEAIFIHNGPDGTGTTTFSVEVSPNNTDWYDYNKLISNLTNTNGQDITRVASLDQTGTTTAIYGIDMSADAFGYVRCIAKEASTTISSNDDATCEITVKE